MIWPNLLLMLHMVRLSYDYNESKYNSNEVKWIVVVVLLIYQLQDCKLTLIVLEKLSFLINNIRYGMPKPIKRSDDMDDEKI